MFVTKATLNGWTLDIKTGVLTDGVHTQEIMGKKMQVMIVLFEAGGSIDREDLVKEIYGDPIPGIVDTRRIDQLMFQLNKKFGFELVNRRCEYYGKKTYTLQGVTHV